MRSPAKPVVTGDDTHEYWVSGKTHNTNQKKGVYRVLIPLTAE